MLEIRFSGLGCYVVCVWVSVAANSLSSAADLPGPRGLQFLFFRGTRQSQ